MSIARPLLAHLVTVAALVLAAVVAVAPAASAQPDPGVVFSPSSLSFAHVGWHGTVTQPFSVVNHTAAAVRVAGPRSNDPHFSFGSG